MKTGRSTATVDTIIAISTAAGTGAVGLVRLSGPGAGVALARHCRLKNGRVVDFASSARKCIFCDVYAAAPEGDSAAQSEGPIDEGLVSYFPGPNSYTGEDTAELTVHGNPLILQEIVQAFVETSANTSDPIRPAGPGEFTRRAYLNGRLDLPKAEAVHRIVTARSRLELEASRKNLYGELSRLVSRFRSAIIHLKAETEAEVDFSTEDLTFESREARVARVRELIGQLERILVRGRETERLRSGFQVALVGVPNAGKSSLLNRMLGWDRAIVSPQAGTTRDYVSEELELNGVPIRFVDTAGLRETDDAIEEAGVRLSRETMRSSQIVLHIIDGERAPYEFPELETPGVVLHIVNKLDVRDAYAESAELREEISRSASAEYVRVSCVSGAGFEELRARLLDVIVADPAVAADPLLLEDRHRYHFGQIQSALAAVLRLWDEGAPDEIVALEIDRALTHTSEFAGHIDHEEVLGRIFSVFCVGK